MIKKQNGMSHLIDTEPVRGNRKRDREEEGAKGRQNAEGKKGLFQHVLVRAHDRVYQCVCVRAHTVCVCPHEGPAEKLEIV